jgi:hypothetical protein
MWRNITFVRSDNVTDFAIVRSQQRLIASRQDLAEVSQYLVDKIQSPSSIRGQAISQLEDMYGLLANRAASNISFETSYPDASPRLRGVARPSGFIHVDNPVIPPKESVPISPDAAKPASEDAGNRKG